MGTDRLPTKLRYPIHVGSRTLDKLPQRLGRLTEERRVGLVTDAWLQRHQAPQLVAAFMSAGWDIQTVRVPRGERAKTWTTVARLHNRWLAEGYTRRTPILAFGGGSVGDAVGFAAATWLRGMPVVQVPTTVLAQVDASVGGKTAIDHEGGKNLVGAFHDPLMVHIDVSLLATLSGRDVRAGLAEVIKLGCVFDPPFLAWLSRHWGLLETRDPIALVRLVRRALKLKAAAVVGDVQDLKGQRELLNFGHTVGHALESASSYRLRHGEAVAWGMRAAVALSVARGGVPDSRARGQVLETIDRLSPPPLTGLKTRAVLRSLGSDKKRSAKGLRFILLHDLGAPYRTESVTAEEVGNVVRPWLSE